MFWLKALFFVSTSLGADLPGAFSEPLQKNVSREQSGFPGGTQKSNPPHRSGRETAGAASLIYSKHWYDPPIHSLKKRGQNLLLIHDLFVISFNPDTRLPDWTAYQLSPATVWGFLKAERKWKPDPLLPPALSLSTENYKGASRWGYDRGHLAPKGSFKGSALSYQAQYITNLVPQKRNLNQGPWRMLEEAVRGVVLRGQSVKILTGPLFDGKPSAVWPSAQGRLSRIPSGYWKIVSLKIKGKVHICSFIMPQEIPFRNSPFKKYKVKTKGIERRAGLLLFNNHKGRTKETCGFLI